MKEKYRLNYSCGIVDGSVGYFSAIQMNGLFKMNMETGVVDFISVFPDEPILKRNMHRSAIRVENKIVFIPSKASNIHVFDMSNNTFSICPINRGNYNGGYCGELINGKIFLFPEMKRGNILVFDCYNQTIMELVNCNQLIEYTGEKGWLAFIRIASFKNKIYCPLYGTNKLLIYDTINNEIVSIELKIDNILGCYSGMEGIWLLNNLDNNLYFWDPDKGIISKYENKEKGLIEQREYNWVIESTQGVYLLPAYGNDISKKVNTNIQQIYRCEDCEGQKTFNPIVCDNAIIICPYSYQFFMVIKEDQVYNINIVLSDQAKTMISVLIANSLNEIGIVKENKELYLSDFLAYMT